LLKYFHNFPTCEISHRLGVGWSTYGSAFQIIVLLVLFIFLFVLYHIRIRILAMLIFIQFPSFFRLAAHTDLPPVIETCFPSWAALHIMGCALFMVKYGRIAASVRRKNVQP
jgi:hypothetical protein